MSSDFRMLNFGCQRISTGKDENSAAPNWFQRNCIDRRERNLHEEIHWIKYMIMSEESLSVGREWNAFFIKPLISDPLVD